MPLSQRTSDLAGSETSSRRKPWNSISGGTQKRAFLGPSALAQVGEVNSVTRS